MRLVSLFVAICFSLNVMASTGTVQELEKMMDDYHYSMSVEWDQKDQAFFNAKTQEFFAGLENLIKTNGLTKEQLLSIVEKKVSDKAIVDAIVLKMGLLSSTANAAELANLVKETAKDMYAKGASWNGSAIVPVAMGLLIAGVIGYAIYWSATHKCVAYEQRYVCNTYNNCYYGGSYDPYYGGYYGGSYCYGGTYTTCGYQNVCTAYEKK